MYKAGETFCCLDRLDVVGKGTQTFFHAFDLPGSLQNEVRAVHCRCAANSEASSQGAARSICLRVHYYKGWFKGKPKGTHSCSVCQYFVRHPYLCANLLCACHVTCDLPCAAAVPTKWKSSLKDASTHTSPRAEQTAGKHRHRDALCMCWTPWRQWQVQGCRHLASKGTLSGSSYAPVQRRAVARQ